ncbi:hypothetical protein [Flavobacterium sp.]|uniref:hypothetical protein n=1 Tax=Flavobacterium sp. TaxID=239 RepID=UPI002FD89F86
MANLTNNRIIATMDAADIVAVKTALVTIQDKIPFLLGLTTDERTSLPKIDVSNKAFVEDAINAAVNNNSMLPSFFKVNDMQIDLNLFMQLEKIMSLVRQLQEKIDDTHLLAGSEAYVSALSAYKLFAAAADAGVPGADAVYDQLRERFTNNTATAASTP